MADGRATLAVVPAPSAARTGGGVGSTIDLGLRSSARLTLTVTALAAPLAVHIDTSPDGVTWTLAKAFADMATTGKQTVPLTGLARYLRAVWSCAGGHTASVEGDASIVYATPADLGRYALPEAALAGWTELEIDDCIRAACAEADQKLARGGNLPLVAWGDGLRLAVARIAAYVFMSRRGYQPEPGARDTFKEQADSGRSWCADAGNNGSPEIQWAATSELPAVVMVSDPPRGWGRWSM